jgi:alpha/beta superfamily hydrolase
MPLVLHASDGTVLEAEWTGTPGKTRGTAVLCHPHPQYGGTMRSIVISALFDALPGRGYECLRFNFRGVERSTGAHGAGHTEPADVAAALEEAVVRGTGSKVALVGWSFGADMALSVDDARVDGWVGIAPPLRFGAALGSVAADPRPKHLVLAQHDEFRAPEDVEREVETWTRTTTEIIAGASHFFVGRTDRVLEATAGFLDALTNE